VAAKSGDFGGLSVDPHLPIGSRVREAHSGEELSVGEINLFDFIKMHFQSRRNVNLKRLQTFSHLTVPSKKYGPSTP
jgi:hypothetical protein